MKAAANDPLFRDGSMTTREDIIAMAAQSGMKASIGMTVKQKGKADVYHPDVNALSKSVPVEWLERFADIVAAKEREACANVAKAISDKYAYGYYGNEVDTADEIEAAIRVRGAL